MEPKRVFVATLIVLGTFAGAYLITRLLDPILLVYGALIFASAIRPIADRLVDRGLPRAAAVLLLYLLALVVLTSGLFIVVPPLIGEAATLVESAPAILDATQQTLQGLADTFGISASGIDLGRVAQEITQRLPSLASGVLAVTISVFSVFVGLVLLLVLALYWSLERNKFLAFILGFLPPEQRDRGWLIWVEIEEKMGEYVRGQIILGFVVGTLAYIGLKILGIPFTLVLAIFAGLTELIPNIGPVLGAIPAVLIAFADSPMKGLLVVGLYVLIQQLENHLLVPKVMERAVGMSPLIVIFAVISGGALLGLVGAIIAVPTAAIIKVVLSQILLQRTARFETAKVEGEAEAAVDDGRAARETPG